MKFDAVGNEIWTFYINQDNWPSSPKDIFEAANGDFLICGHDRSLHTINQKPFVMRVTSAGALLWAKAYVIGTDSYIKGCMEDPLTGDIYFTGHS